MSAYGVNQSGLYNMRPPNTTRDRSMEQYNTGSGNPYGYIPQSPYQIGGQGGNLPPSPYNYNQYNPGRYVPPQILGGPWSAQTFTTGPLNYNMPGAQQGGGGNPWQAQFVSPGQFGYGGGGMNPYYPQFGGASGGGQFNPYGYPGQQLFPYGQQQNNPQFYPQFQQLANQYNGGQQQRGVGYNAPNNVQQYPGAPQSNPQQQLADRIGQLPGGSYNLMGSGNGRYIPNYSRTP